MADYDLGTAHGRIEIDADNSGTAAAIRQMAELRAAAASLESSLDRTSSSFEDYDRGISQVEGSTGRTSRQTSSFIGVLRSLGSASVGSAGDLETLSTKLERLASVAQAADRQVQALSGSVQRFSVIGGAFDRLAGSINDVDAQMAKIPQWQRNIVHFSSATASLGQLAAITRRLAITMAEVGAGTAVFRTAAPRILSMGNGFRTLLGTAALLSPRLSAVGSAVRSLGERIGVAGSQLGTFTGQVLRGVTGLSQIITGSLLVGKALEGIGTAAKYATIGLGAVSVAGAGLEVLGTTILGVWDAAKQLSGLAGLLPGAFLGLGISVGVAKLAFSGIGDAMKAAFGPAEDFDKKIKDLSPTMQSLAKAVRDTKPQLEGLRNTAQNTALAGLGNDIKTLTNLYFPMMQVGIGRVGNSLNMVKNALRDFLLQPATGAGINQAMGLTAQLIANISRAIQPAATAFLNLGIVGLQALTDLSGGLSNVAQKFNLFIQQNRDSGAIRAWINDAVQGVKDLGTVVSKTGSITSSIFHAFGSDGEDALGRLAAAMTKFADKAATSAASGGLKTVADSLQRMSATSMETLSAALGQVARLLQTLAPLAEQISISFGTDLVQVIQVLGTAFNLLASAIAHIPGMGSFIGELLALAVAMKGVQLLFSPLVRGFQLIAGLGGIFTGITKTVTGFNGAMKTAAASGELAATAIGKVRSVASAAIGVIGGGLGVAIIGATAAIEGFSQQNQDLATLQGILKDKVDGTTKSVQGFTAAFEKANGVVGKPVVQEATKQFDDLQNKLDETSKKQTGWMSDTAAFFKDAFSFSGIKGTLSDDPVRWLNNEKNSQLDHLAQAAQRAKDSFNELGISSENVGKAITGSDAEFAALEQSLRGTSNGGQDAINSLSQVRQAFVTTRDSMARVGPATVQLGEALKVISDASSTAAEKLDAIKSALQALGLLETDATTAAFDTSKAIKAVADSAAEAADPAGGLGAALIDASGNLDHTKENAQNLRDSLRQLGDKLQETASAGGDVNGAYREMGPVLDALGQKYGLNRDQIDKFGASLGILPKELTLFVAMKGAPEATQEALVLASRLQAVPANTPVNVIMRDQGVIAALQAIGAQVQVVNSTTGEVRINAPTEEVRNKVLGLVQLVQNGATGQFQINSNVDEIRASVGLLVPQITGLNGLKPNVNIGTNAPNISQQLMDLQGIAQKPVPAPPVNPPQAPPVQPSPIQPPLPAPQVQTPVTPAPIAPPIVPPIAAPPVQQPVTPAPLPPPPQPPIQLPAPVVPQPVVPPVPPIPAPIVEQPKVPDLPPLPQYPPIVLQITGTENVTGALANIGGAIDGSQGKWAAYGQAIAQAMQAATTAIQGFANSVGPALSGMADTARNSGAALGQGFADGINSKVDAVRQAAMNLANAAAAPLPRSPAKIGPFSGTGWTPYRGQTLALGFAEGITAGAQEAKDAALLMARLVSAALDSVAPAVGQVPTSFDANRPIGSGGAMFYRDPSISNAQLAEQRQKKAEEKAQADRDKAFRDQKEQNKKVVDFNNKLVISQDKNSKEADLMADSNNKDLVGAMTKVANAFGLQLTSGVREGDPGFHGTGQAADFSNGVGTDAELAFANFINKNFKPFTKELIFQDPRFAGNEIKNGQNVPSSFFAGSGDTNDHVHWAVDVAPVLVGPIGDIVKQNLPSKKEQQSQTQSTNDAIRSGNNSTNQSQQQIVDAIVAEGKRQGLSDEDIAAGVSTGIVESNLQNLPYGDRTSVGVFQQQDFAEWTTNRDRMNVSDAARSFFEHYKQTDPSLSPGARAQQVQRSAFPDKYAQQMAQAQALTAESLQRQGQQVGTQTNTLNGIYTDTSDTRSEQEKSLDELRKNNATLDQAIKTAQNPNSTDEEVIRALQDIHDGIAVTEDPDAREGLKSVESAVMQDRGIKQYDPTEGASKDPIGDTIKIAQGIVGLFDTVEQGFSAAGSAAEQLIRGFKNTKDVNNFIDSVQSVASAVGSVISTVSDVISTVASIAALAGAAIPGIGQVAAVASVVTGGIANVNAVVDLVQQVGKIIGRFVGGGLSMLAGGANGALMGNVHVLLDTNDGTIKTWSEDNPDDKRVHSLSDPFATQNNTQTSVTGVNSLQVYGGPGEDTAKVMDDAMFAVRAAQVGAGAYG